MGSFSSEGAWQYGGTNPGQPSYVHTNYDYGYLGSIPGLTWLPPVNTIEDLDELTTGDGSAAYVIEDDSFHVFSRGMWVKVAGQPSLPCGEVNGLPMDGNM